MTLEQLQLKRGEEVRAKADEIIQSMVDRNRTDWSVETCSRDGCGWKASDHVMMGLVATELRARGLTVTSQVNFEITDWTIIA